LTEAFCRDVTLRQIAWFCNNADGDKQPVAGKLPNPWGLYDMLGNVWEWCWDSVFGDADHSLDSLTDPTGPPTTSNRIQRGGSFNSSAQSARAASRRYIGLGQQNTEVGFRPARTTP
jgi:formylglycine-generating enzyme required for sulfatase activity